MSLARLEACGELSTSLGLWDCRRLATRSPMRRVRMPPLVVVARAVVPAGRPAW